MSSPYRRQKHFRQDKLRTRYSPHSGRDSGGLLASLLTNELFQQLAPILVIFVVPLFALLLNKYKRTLFYPLRLLLRCAAMVLQTLVAALPWNWSAGSRERKTPEKVVRTRAEQVQISNGSAGEGSSKGEYDVQDHEFEPEDAEDDGYYPGIVNISGTYCFMDSTLQALASLTYLQPYIEAIHIRAEEYDVPTPVVDALRDILHELNTPRSSRTSLRPHALIEALSVPPSSSTSTGSRSSSRLFSSREHQDAQELFQVLTETVKTEAAEVAREAGRDLGLGGALSSIPKQPSYGIVNGSATPHRDPELEVLSITKSVFDGLTANRRSCVECGYTEAVMHFSFDSWQLALPRVNACRLEDCLVDYTRLEVLTDCICRRCSMEATYEKYAKEGVLEKPTSPSSSPTTASPVRDAFDGASATPISKSKKKRAQEARKLASRVKALIDEGRVEEDVKGVQVVRVTRASTKQAMVARPPPALVLHLNRSLHFGGAYGAAKNSCQVLFSEILDLTPYTTNGMLNTSPQAPISGSGLRSSMFSQSPSAPKVDSSTRTLYRLAAVVVHYGQHSFGHYVCYRRKPRPAWLPDARRWTPPRAKSDDEGGLASLESSRGTGRGWLRLSDDDVRECGIESVLQEGAGAFMLYYERIIVPPSVLPSAALPNGQTHPVQQNGPAAVPINGVDGMKRHKVYLDDDERTPRCSEETLKPANGFGRANGSIVSLASTLVDDAAHEDGKLRGVQSVASVGLSTSPGLSSLAMGNLAPRLVRRVSLQAQRADSRPASERMNSFQKVDEAAEGAVQPNGSATTINGGHMPDAS